MLKKVTVLGLTVGAMVLMAPFAASADTEGTDPANGTYATPPRAGVEKPVIDTCDVSTIVFGAGYFGASETVGVSVSGLNATDAAVSGNTASADGSMVVSFRPPANGSGSYGVTFTGAESSYTATVSISQTRSSNCGDPEPAPAETELPLTGGSAGSAGSADDTFELALTGGDVSPWVVGGGALALAAGGTLLIAGATRRKRA